MNASTNGSEPGDGGALEWHDLVPAQSNQSVKEIDIIIPVYRGLNTTLNCINSVLRSDAALIANLIVINDCSPDMALEAALDDLSGKGLFKLIRNQENYGFVKTVNLGMTNSENDVILLNSDTVVYGDWVSRLHKQARSASNVGTVTPFSNNATICSYPITFDDNSFELELSGSELDAILARCNDGQSVEIPTAVGFCMYIRRDCLKQVGLFDAELFGKGYCEENDFCCRATASGWTHLLAGDVYVSHIGSVSFGKGKTNLFDENFRKLNDRHPSYWPSVQRFASQDEARPLRRQADIERIRRKLKKPILFISHDRGGGTERHIQDMRTALEAQGQSVLFLRPIANRPSQFFLEAPDVFAPNINPLDPFEQEPQLLELFKLLEIAHIHVHSLFDADERFLKRLSEIADKLGIKYDVTIHDYLSICPRTFLVDGSGYYCGEPAPEGCKACITKNGTLWGDVSIEKWRSAYEQFLAGARRVFAPNLDVIERIRRYYPAQQIYLRPHVETLSPQAPLKIPPRAEGEKLKIAIFGVLAIHKGVYVLEALSRDALRRDLPIQFVVFGQQASPTEPYRAYNIIETGPYEEDAIYELIAQTPCHLALFPAVWPETYSYTLSIALKAGLFPVAFDLGAIAERIRDIAWGELLPVSLMHDAAFINDILLSLKPKPRPAESVLFPENTSYKDFRKDYYELNTAVRV